MSKVFKTAIFVLHNPSVWKIKVLESAGQKYRNTVQELLDYFNLHQKEIQTKYLEENPDNKAMSTRWLENYLSKTYAGTTNKPRELFDGANKKACGMILSYLALKKDTDDKTNYPRIIINKAKVNYFQSLDNFTQREIESDEEYSILEGSIKYLDERAKLLGSYVRKRDFHILHKPKTNKYYAALHLGSNVTPLDKAGKKDFIDIATGNHFIETRKKVVVFPLSFSKWHEKEFIYRGVPKAAEILKINDRYELHVSFDMPTEDKVKTETYLGIDRNLLNTVAWAVIGKKGQSIYESIVDGRNYLKLVMEEVLKQKDWQKKGRRECGHKRKNVSILTCHIITNLIVECAKKYKSQVVMEYLNLQGPYSKKYQQYNRIEKMLEYKLQLAGLHKLVKRGAAWTSQTCHKCGYIDPNNRGKFENRDKFKCLNCNYEGNADTNAAINIARKALWKKDKN